MILNSSLEPLNLAYIYISFVIHTLEAHKEIIIEKFTETQLRFTLIEPHKDTITEKFTENQLRFTPKSFFSIIQIF